MDQKTFEQLPKAEQNFRWALFIVSDGHRKELTANQIEKLKQKHLIQGLPVTKYS